MKSEERFEVVNDIITGISRRKADKFFNRLTSEDIAQELWIVIIEKEKSLGKELDLDLIAKICYDEINGMIRKSLRQKRANKMTDASYEELEEMGYEFPIDGRSNDPADCNSLIIRDIINLFEVGSKERYYLEYWATSVDILNAGITGDGKYQDGFTEKDLADKLGYASSRSGGFIRLRNKVRESVNNYIKDEK